MRVTQKDVTETGITVTLNGATITDFLFADDTGGRICQLVDGDNGRKKVKTLRGRVVIKAG